MSWCSGPGETWNELVNPLLLQQLTAFRPPSRYYFAEILDISAGLAAGRSDRFICRSIVLQELVHRLQCLVVLIEDL
jgi:hypothetical protein